MRFVGVAAGLVVLAAAIVARRRRSLSRVELFWWTPFGLAVVLLSALPAVAQPLADTLRLKNRLFALLVVAGAVLAAASLYLLRRLNRVEQNIGLLVRKLAIREFHSRVDATSVAASVAVVIAAFNEER